MLFDERLGADALVESMSGLDTMLPCPGSRVMIGVELRVGISDGRQFPVGDTVCREFHAKIRLGSCG
jgi:hypothetical protein